MKVIREFAEMPSNTGASFYSLTARELTDLRAFLRTNIRKHSECRQWLRYFNEWLPRPPERHNFDDYDDGLRFGAFCRQFLALQGVIVQQREGRDA